MYRHSVSLLSKSFLHCPYSNSLTDTLQHHHHDRAPSEHDPGLRSRAGAERGPCGRVGQSKGAHDEGGLHFQGNVSGKNPFHGVFEILSKFIGRTKVSKKLKMNRFMKILEMEVKI